MTSEHDTTAAAGPIRLADGPIEPVVKIRPLPLTPAAAFELFTAGIERWWPLATHSIAGADATAVHLEGRVGGRVIETAADGTTSSWADVLAWDPPHRLVLSWHPQPDPIAASIVEVRFEADGQGCLLRLEHRGWEEFGSEAGQGARDAYDPGWDQVLAPFEEAAGAGPVH